MTHTSAPRSIGARTRLVSLLGHPVAHSRSPSIHNAAFAAQGVDMVYLAFDVPPEALAHAVAGLRALGVAGANLTVPHKEAVLPLLDRIHPLAERLGAVNTLVNEDGAIVGHNTDVYGFLMGLERGWGRGPRGARCLVLGAGGAARAVVAALSSEEAAEILVYNRTLSRARELCADAGAWSNSPCRPVTLDELAQAAQSADLVVNATSVGLGETVKETPLPVDMLKDNHVVMDLIYGAEPTVLLSGARDKGALAIDGTEMLVQQAARSYELWTGRTAPVDLMRTHA